MAKHYSKLPPVSGPYERIPDEYGTAGQVVRMVRCLVDGAEIPSLGIAYHERGNAHRDGAKKVGRERYGELAQSQRRTYSAGVVTLTPHGRRLRIAALEEKLRGESLTVEESEEFARLVVEEREAAE